jgi:dolichol-phosphate mannosyltransferase
MKILSVVIPAFNEQESITRCISKITEIFAGIDFSKYELHGYELIVVDDGSTDDTLRNIVTLKEQDSRIRIICMKANYGHMYALEAGLKASHGEYIVSIDADLQEPPEAIEIMLSILHLNKDLDYVQSTRNQRENDTYFKRKTAELYYKTIRRVTDIDVTPNAADFRVIRRETLDLILALPEKQKVFRLLLPKLKMRSQTIEVTRSKRLHDKSKYNLKMMAKLAINSLVGFSSKPLRLIALVGIFMAMFFLLASLVTIFVWFNYNTVPGWTSIALLVLLTQSVNVLCISLIAEYVSRIFNQVIDRPSFQSFEISS